MGRPVPWELKQRIKMGKIKIKTLGSEELEKEQKDASKRKREQKQLRKAAIESPVEGKAEDLKVPGEVKASQDTALDTEGSQVEKTKETKEVVSDDKKTRKKPKKIKIRGKIYLKAKKTIDKGKKYALADAVNLVLSLDKRGFDESVELHLQTIDTGVKGEVALPHGTGKTLRIVVADDGVVAKLEKGTVDFDILITTPSFMPNLVKYAKLLGPKGLMPNPKQGTVTDDTDGAIKKFSKGQLYFKTETKFPLMHVTVGKKSFTSSQLVENVKSFVSAVGKQKIQSMYVSSTMSPSVSINVDSI